MQLSQLEELLANVVDEHGTVEGDVVVLEVPDKVMHPRNMPVMVEFVECRGIYRLSTPG